uniref:5'-nucleotidase n=1 Tax=Sipha flava TaxID=143950 RepID=A0A2S2QGF2_9HEMI
MPKIRATTSNRLNKFAAEYKGLKVVIDLGWPTGKRVQSVYARCGNCVVPIYEQLDLNGNYTVIMSSYLANGGNGHKFQKVVDFQDIGSSELKVMEEEIQIKSPIRPEVDGRITLLNADKLPRTTGDT